MTKGPAVQQMFDAIAGHYDLMNRVMTGGQDQRWRRFVVAKAGPIGAGRALDLATGTGDIAALTKQHNPQAVVIAADFSRNMLREAQRRFAGSPIAWHACDANQLPYGDSVFQAVTFGYLLRNVDQVAPVLSEVYRVLQPSGRVVCLDTTPPVAGPLRPLLQLYFSWGIPLLGRLLARDRSAYAYLTGSTLHFHGAETLAGFFRAAGFQQVAYQRFMLGTICIHWGEK